jgi:hypothetical protein
MSGETLPPWSSCEPTFAQEGIPPEFLSHYDPDGTFAFLSMNDGLSDKF